MHEFAIKKVLDAYNIDAVRIFSFQKGYRNEIWPILNSDKQMINLTFYKREPGIIDRINRADNVSGYLVSNGFPAKKRYDPRVLLLKSGDITVNICAYYYLPGSTIPWEAYTMKRIKTLGATMSNMHACLRLMPKLQLPSVYDEYLSIIELMDSYFIKPTVKTATMKKLKIKIDTDRLNSYMKLLNNQKTTPNQQVLHMDFVRGNILFDKNKITGILDFEKTAFGHVDMDIARTLAFLLVDFKHKTNAKVEKYFLHSGYKKRGQNKKTINESNLKNLVEMFLLYDLYKFMRHNPYESLFQNEHFVRTKDILVRYGVVSLK
jgi:Ser/Thr protein kinase RdoA (MazF antagonist)